MGGTKAGGISARDKNQELYGKDYYSIIGAIGGSKSRTGGFHGNSELARRAGALGGRVSRRTAGERTELTGKQRQALRRKKNIARAYKRLAAIQAKSIKSRNLPIDNL